MASDEEAKAQQGGEEAPARGTAPIADSTEGFSNDGEEDTRGEEPAAGANSGCAIEPRRRDAAEPARQAMRPRSRRKIPAASTGGKQPKKRRRTAVIGTTAVVASIGIGVAVVGSAGSDNKVAAIETDQAWMHPDVLVNLLPTIRDVVGGHDADVTVETNGGDGHVKVGVVNPMQYRPELVKILEVSISQFGGNPYIGGASNGVFPITASQFAAELPKENRNRVAHNEPLLPTDDMRAAAAKYLAPGQVADNFIAQENPRASIAAGALMINEFWIQANGGKWDAQKQRWSGVDPDKIFGEVPASFVESAYTKIASGLGISGANLTAAVKVSLGLDVSWGEPKSATFTAVLKENRQFLRWLELAVQGQRTYIKANGSMNIGG